MSEPKSMEEFTKIFHENNKVEGHGLDVEMHSPCPFCAAPNWMIFKIMETEKMMAKGATCSQCGRSGRFIMSSTSGGGTSFQFVQTGGAPPPAWMDPQPQFLKDS